METVEQFLARGGKINSVQEGERALTRKEMYMLSRGEKIEKYSDYTDRSMREAENMGMLDNQEMRLESLMSGD